MPRFGGQNGLARELGTTSGVVNRWLHCRVIPSTRWASRIQDVAQIPIDAWMRKGLKRDIRTIMHQ